MLGRSLLKLICKALLLYVVHETDQICVFPHCTCQGSAIWPMCMCLQKSEDAGICCGRLRAEQERPVAQQCSQGCKVLSNQNVDVLIRVGQDTLQTDLPSKLSNGLCNLDERATTAWEEQILSCHAPSVYTPERPMQKCACMEDNNELLSTACAHAQICT